MSQKQSSIAVSSCEAEFIAASGAYKAVQWLTNLLGELGVHHKMTIQMDSTSTIQLIRHARCYGRNKHVELRYLTVRTAYEKGKIDVCYTPTTDMAADFLNKATNKSTLLRQRNLSGLETWQ